MRYYTKTDKYHNVTPVAPHDVRDQDKFAALVASFENGDEVNPVVVLKLGSDDSYPQAITGSHRIAAAREARVSVPCVVIEATNPWERGLLSSILSGNDYNDKAATCDRLAQIKNMPEVRAALADQIC